MSLGKIMPLKAILKREKKFHPNHFKDSFLFHTFIFHTHIHIANGGIDNSNKIP